MINICNILNMEYNIKRGDTMKNLKSNKKFIISPNIFIVFILFLIVISTNLINISIKDNKTINNDINNKDSISNNVASINSKNNNETTSEDINLLYNNPNDEYLVLVNKEHSLEENYEPNDLVIPNIPLQTSSDMTAHVRYQVAVELENMFNDAKKDGINLIGISGYRSCDYQTTVYNDAVANEGVVAADSYVAHPGHSEHQTGLSIDILSSEYSTLDEGFENTEAFKWLSENINSYGFIIRYPKGKEDITGYSYEPWHLRYVGKNAAKEITENQLTLEEYLK